MDTTLVLLILALVFGFYMAWNIGANDVANAMGTSVGSKALTLRNAVIVAAILEFSGAFLAGGRVSETLQKGIVDPFLYQAEPMLFVYGMLAALLATGIWLQIASFFGWPVSTTHAIVGSILGFGLVSKGIHAIDWKNVTFIATGWIASPILAGILSYFIFSVLQRTVLFAAKPLDAAIKKTPIFVFFIIFILCLAVIFDGLKSLDLHLSFLVACLIAAISGLIASFVSKLLLVKFAPKKGKEINAPLSTPKNALMLSKAMKHLQRVSLNSSGEFQKKTRELFDKTKVLYSEARQTVESTQTKNQYVQLEKIFASLQILSACFVAFAHGSNDVANAVGPLTAVLMFLKTGMLNTVQTTHPIILAFGGLGIVIGLATWGWRVIETIGKKITELTPTRGFSAEFGAATTIMIASKLGMPVSTTQSLVGALLGVGFARGMKAINLKMIRSIVISWIVTIPISCLFCIIIYYLMLLVFG